MSSEAPLRETPTLERLLNRLGRELRLQVWMHGLGTVLLVAALWCVWTFIADWGLSVPRPMRIVHALLLVGLPVWFAWRSLLRPLRHVPDRAGLAVLLERAQTQKDELLVSAAQLQACPDGDPVLVQRVLAEAESRARSVETDAVIDKSGPRLRLFGGFISVGALLAVFASQGELTGIFLNHLLGGTQAWPRQTTLLVELPLPGGDDALRTVPGAIEGQPAEIIARVARGSDVRVVVTAEGKLPDRVTLHFEGGEELMLTPAGGATFRQVIRSCQDDLSFWVTGGDDNDREPMVRIEVLQPPDVAGLAVAVQPPAYSGLEPSLEFDRDVEVLAGSELLVHVLPDPPGATGHVLLLPEDRQIPLEPAPFPTADGSATRPGLAFRLNPDRSLRFRVELTDEEGLENPDPGLFSIAVVEDRAPDLVVLGPGRGDVETVVGGTLALRVRAEDDFGLGALSWSARPYLAEDAVGVGGELEQRPLPRTEDTAVRDDTATHRIGNHGR